MDKSPSKGSEHVGLNNHYILFWLNAKLKYLFTFMEASLRATWQSLWAYLKVRNKIFSFSDAANSMECLVVPISSWLSIWTTTTAWIHLRDSWLLMHKYVSWYAKNDVNYRLTCKLIYIIWRIFVDCSVWILIKSVLEPNYWV